MSWKNKNKKRYAILMQLQGMVSTDNNSNEIVIVMKKQILKIKMSGYHELE